jgi:signal transduction histidine kinase
MMWRSRRLQHQLFLWLGLTSLATVLAAGLALRGLEPAWQRRSQQLSGFAAGQFAERWTEPAARRDLAEKVAEAFEATLILSDAGGAELERVGSGQCRGPGQTLQVTRAGSALGSVRICLPVVRRFGLSLLAVLGSACLVLWASAALVARRLVRPLSVLIATTREIGSGNLAARVRLGRHQHGELALLAESVNDMAQRIERQLRDQRELLAAVSHEVRSPLARLRIASELLRSSVEPDAVEETAAGVAGLEAGGETGVTRGGAETRPRPRGPACATALDALEREVNELDVLVGKLLANSRLDFELLSRTSLAAAELFADVLVRRQLNPGLLRDESGGRLASLDATLIERALDNLLENALHHGGGVHRCGVRLMPAGAGGARESLVFEVCDAGPGFSPDALSRAFEPFYRSTVPGRGARGSLGLGLALVQRIARAHGGRAWAENVANGGARVSFSVAL